MKKVANTIYIPWLIVAIAINFSAIGQAAEMKLSQEQQKIWGLVESYWESAQNGDLESLMNLLHEKYVYWPKGYKVTFNKSEMEFMFTKWLTHNRPKMYELSLSAIQLFNNFAIVHYSYNTKGNWGPEVGRITSVWMKNNGEWKLIGAMNANLP
ncbi:MAG: nuclear transport factor 2 family protein [Deltaproteobacteria bacterium]|nr:nuclear transport factor 2 family protein [Deltaproteobacteria bacterium]